MTNQERCVKRIKAAIEALDAAAGNLSVDSVIRMYIVRERQNVEDLLAKAERA